MRKMLILIACMSSISFAAQQTGSFSMNISFNQPDYSMTNELAFYVPTDYDSSVSYALIVGFRGGPHIGPGQLRDQLQPLSDSLNAIIMCPESVSLWQNSQEVLVKQLFQYALDTTANMYNIDMNMIYVTGLSFGGRHAVIVGMDTDAGPIYPGLRGIIPFAAGIDSQNVPNYDMNPGTPICTCIGQEDSNTFYTVSYTLHFNATGNGWTTFFNEIPGVGHTMAFPTFIDEMMECIDFIEAQYATSLIEENEFEFTLSPNPAHDQVRITGYPSAVPLEIEIRDLRGKTLYMKTFEAHSNEVSIDLSSLTKGQYILSIKSCPICYDMPRRSIRTFIIE
jgi:hypothetical protein